MSYGGGYGGAYNMQVESAIVGRIIGRRGVKIRELEADSNTRIKISRDEDENGLKTVEISGTEDEINHAKVMIGQCLDPDYRGGGGSSGGRGGYSGQQRSGGYSGGQRRDDGGGWGGQQRRDDGGGWGRRDRDGGDGWGRRNEYGGNRGGGGRGGYGSDEPTSSESIYVDKGEVGRIIGRGGAKIRELENESRCKIKVSRDGTTSSEVTIEGSPTAIVRAKLLITETGAEILEAPGESCNRGW